MASAAKMAASVTRLKGGVVVAREPRRKGRLGVQRQQSLNGNFKQRGTTRVEAKHVNMTCPICMDVLEYEEGREDKDEKGPITLPPKKVSCSSCNWSKDTESDTFFDLTVLPSNAIRGNDPSSSEILNAVTGLFQDPSEASESNTYKEKLWSVSQLFQSPVISYVYERGWRQGFDWAGFPGADKEFEILQKLFETSETRPLSQLQSPSSVLDVSCGTGLFSRKFLKSGTFDTIVASDYSENMLEQAYNFLNEKEFDAAIDAKKNPELLLVRADVGRLPFPSKTFDLVHAGAAIHCWPTPSLAIAEITRVLKPGGRLIGSTFLLAAAPLGQSLGNDNLVRPLFELEKEFSGGVLPALSGRNYRFWEEKELKDLCDLCGLENFQVERDNRFIMFCATKPFRQSSEKEDDLDTLYSSSSASLPEDSLTD